MSIDDYKNCIKIAACICAKDGVISSAEEQEMFGALCSRFPDVDQSHFEVALVEFFDSDEQIESYLERISDGELRVFALRLAEVSASADGLDIRENIALEKAYAFWGVSLDA